MAEVYSGCKSGWLNSHSVPVWSKTVMAWLPHG
jgi:hypothetical protein